MNLDQVMRARRRLYVGAQNDILYLVTQPPRPSTDDWLDADGPDSRAVAKMTSSDRAAQKLAEELVAGYNFDRTVEPLLAALQEVDRNGCTSYTVGRCFDKNTGRTRNAPYVADKWCDACVARDALNAYEGVRS